jgi:hypothetical protein
MSERATSERHTPGPWHIGESIDEYQTGSESWNVPVWANHADPGDRIAAEALAKDREQARANARLIAAAPELLEACKGLVRIADAVRYTAGLGKNQMARVDAARAAIAKATPAGE